jgi:hypothetical protein
MAEVLIEYPTLLAGRDGRRYRAQSCGRERNDGLWEGWIEFLPVEEGVPPLRTGRETTQPNRDDVRYWASGITDPYLDGALDRALTRATQAPRDFGVERARPVFGGPADRAVPTPAAVAQARQPHAVLDPFHVYAEGAGVLRDQLLALSIDQLDTVARAYGLADTTSPAYAALTRAERVGHVVDAVQRAAEG